MALQALMTIVLGVFTVGALFAACGRTPSAQATSGMRCSVLGAAKVTKKEVVFHFHCEPLSQTGDWQIHVPYDSKKVK